MRSIVRGLRDALAGRRAPVAAAILGILLVLPSLQAGLHLDDHYHRQLLLTESHRISSECSLDIFSFVTGDSEQIRTWMNDGVLPWWTSTDIKARFWRPVAAVTHWLDYRLWPTSSVMMHAHSVLWFGLLIGLIGVLYRRMLTGAWAAGLAVVLFAIDDAHGLAVGWVANRNVLVAAFFGVACLWSHDRWRRDNWRPGAWLAPVCLLLALLSRESAVALFSYLVAYGFVMEKGRVGQRLLSLGPSLFVLIAWRAAWSWLGYGVSGIAYYVDPLTEPLRYLETMIPRLLQLLVGQFALPPTDLFVLLPQVTNLVLPLAILMLLVPIFIGLWPLFRDRALARFWGIGTLGALLPVVATTPSDRLLFFSGIGAMVLLAMLFQQLTTGPRPGGERTAARRFRVFLIISLVAIHIVVPLFLLPIRAAQPVGSASLLRRLHIPADLSPSPANKNMVLLNTPSYLHAAYYPLIREANEQPSPRSLFIMSTGTGEIEVARPDPRTLIVTPARGFLKGMFDELYRKATDHFSVGDRIELEAVAVKILEVTSDGRPQSVAFTFQRPLDDPSFLWLKYDSGHHDAVTVPALGDRLIIPESPPVFDL